MPGREVSRVTFHTFPTTYLLKDRLSVHRLGRPCMGATAATSLSCACRASKCGSHDGAGSCDSLRTVTCHSWCSWCGQLPWCRTHGGPKGDGQTPFGSQ